MVKDIYFGKSSAENEADVLHNYFISTRAYLNAKDNNKKKLFYVGNRGAGKSALFNQLSYEYRNKQKNIIVELMPYDFSYSTFKEMEHNFIDIKAAFNNAWYYTLLCNMFENIVQYFDGHRNLKKNRDNVKMIDEFLVQNGIKKNKTGVKLLIYTLRRLSALKVKIKAKQFEVESKGPKEEDIIDLFAGEDIRMPINALEYIAVSHPVYLFIDELDRGWDNSQESHNFINGLLFAADKINKINNVYVYVSLRQDMYNNLLSFFQDAEKMRADIEFLKWDKDNLKALIGRRLINENRLIRQCVDIAAYDQALDMIFERDVFDYIINNTLRRPREVIELCNLVAEKYSDVFYARHLHKRKIDYRIVDDVMERFSCDRFDDVSKEFDNEFPRIKQIMESFECCESEMSKDKFIELLEGAMINFVDRNPDVHWINDYIERPLKLLAKLYEIGFIKISKGYGYYAIYERSQTQYRNVKMVKINNVFRKALQCR